MSLHLHILQLISSAGFYGAENVLLELSNELKNLGHSVTIGIFKNLHNPNLELIDRAKEYSLKTEIFNCDGRIDFKTVSQISFYVKENVIDIIHTHGYKSNIYAVLSNIKNKKPLVSTCHNWINSNGKTGFYTSLDKFFLKFFDTVVPVSNAVKELILKSGINKKRVKLIENGINIRRFNQEGKNKDLLKEFGIDFNCKVIGTVGRLSEEKGHIYLLRAAKKILDFHKRCCFLLVGDGVLRKPLEDEARVLGIDKKVIFTGKRNDIPDFLSIMDIFVLSSLTEGQPMALLEAMASKKTIVATGVGDIPKILKGGELGIVVPPNNSDAIAEGISLYLNYPERAELTASMSYKEAVGKYSSVRMSEEYLNVYKNLISC